MSANLLTRVGQFLAVLFLFIGTVHSISCYQCDSTNSTHPFQCNEFLSADIDLTPKPCDAVFDAQYCVKHVGRFEARALDCYQCTSADEWKCSDGEMVKSSLQPGNCSHIDEARYCIKTTGRYGGGIGTKRFCSSLHLGNYCDYVKQQGDKLTYRTCVFTCSGNGCNPATRLATGAITWLIPTCLLLFRR